MTSLKTTVLPFPTKTSKRRYQADWVNQPVALKPTIKSERVDLKLF